MKPFDHTGESTPQKGRDTAWWLFITAVLVFLSALGIMSLYADFVISPNKYYPSSVVSAGVVFLFVTIPHTLVNLSLTISLLILRRWRLAAGVFALGAIATIPLAIVAVLICTE